MNVFNHLVISIRIKNAIEGQLPVKLKTFSFMYGSIKPDISKEFNNIPHYRNASHEYLDDEIKNILLSDNPIFRECSSDFSQRLGVLTHYLSDFFCFAHSEKFSGGIIKHSIYEMKLMAYCAVKFRKVYCPKNYRSLSSEQNSTEICEFIDELHDEYSDAVRKPSVADDMTFTHEACIALCLSILSSCIAEEHSEKLKLAEVIV